MVRVPQTTSEKVAKPALEAGENTTIGSPAAGVALKSASRVEPEEQLRRAKAMGHRIETVAVDPNRRSAQRTQTSEQNLTVQKKPDRTGLGNNLKAGLETLSGYSMEDVKVHYDSAAPAQFKAQATTRGSEIHLGPGHEQHLPHEAWHVVQQKQNRVEGQAQFKGFPINDDPQLEQEADQMGRRLEAFTRPSEHAMNANPPQGSMRVDRSSANPKKLAPVQLKTTTQIDIGILGLVNSVTIGGRPDSLHSGTMGDHTTAFVLQRDSIINRFHGRTLQEALDELRGLAHAATSLPGYAMAKGDKYSKPLDTGASKKKGKKGRPKKSLEQLEREVNAALDATQEAIKAKSPTALTLLQEAVNAYLSFREHIPLSTINVAAFSKSAAGSGKNESGLNKVLQYASAGNSVDDNSLLAAVWGLLDSQAVALLLVMNAGGDAIGVLEPYLKDLEIDHSEASRRKLFEAIWQQHVQSVSFANPKLSRRLHDLAKARRDEIWDLIKNSIRLLAVPKKQGGAGLLYKTLLDNLPYMSGFSPLPFPAVANTIAKNSSKLESSKTYSVQIVTNRSAGSKNPILIQQIRISGRPEPPPSSGHGAHTTAWYALVDAITTTLRGRTLDQALAECVKIKEDLERERAEAEAEVAKASAPKVKYSSKKKSASKRTSTPASKFTFDKDKAFGSRPVNSPANLKDITKRNGKNTPLEQKISLLQKWIRSLLAFRNETPGAAVWDASTDGGGESTYRPRIRRFEALLAQVEETKIKRQKKPQPKGGGGNPKPPPLKKDESVSARAFNQLLAKLVWKLFAADTLTHRPVDATKYLKARHIRTIQKAYPYIYRRIKRIINDDKFIVDKNEQEYKPGGSSKKKKSKKLDVTWKQFLHLFPEAEESIWKTFEEGRGDSYSSATPPSSNTHSSSATRSSSGSSSGAARIQLGGGWLGNGVVLNLPIETGGNQNFRVQDAPGHNNNCLIYSIAQGLNANPAVATIGHMRTHIETNFPDAVDINGYIEDQPDVVNYIVGQLTGAQNADVRTYARLAGNNIIQAGVIPAAGGATRTVTIINVGANHFQTLH